MESSQYSYEAPGASYEGPSGEPADDPPGHGSGPPAAPQTVPSILGPGPTSPPAARTRSPPPGRLRHRRTGAGPPAIRPRRPTRRRPPTRPTAGIRRIRPTAAVRAPGRPARLSLRLPVPAGAARRPPHPHPAHLALGGGPHRGGGRPGRGTGGRRGRCGQPADHRKELLPQPAARWSIPRTSRPCWPRWSRPWWPSTASRAGSSGSGDFVEAAGTGMILTPDGEVLTNNHVVSGATSVTVTLFGQTKALPAHVIGTDPSVDVALVQIDHASGLPTVTPGRLATDPGRRLGPGHRQRTGPGRRAVGDRGHRLGGEPDALGPERQRADREPDRPAPDRRRHQPRELGRPAGRLPGAGGRHEHRGGVVQLRATPPPRTSGSPSPSTR